MLILSRNGIKNLHIELGHYFDRCTIPSSFFSCLALEHVHIVYGKIYVPPSFLGFKFVRTLRLLEINLCLTGVVLAKLILSCPLLEILELSDICVSSYFVLRAPNLRWLSITGYFVDLCLETPMLLFAKIFHGDEPSGCDYVLWKSIPIEFHCDILRVLGNLSAIEELQLCSYFLQCFAMRPKPDQVLPVPLYQLTELHIDFYEISSREVAAAFCLFKSAPKLKVLSLKLLEEEDTKYSSSLAFRKVAGIKSILFNCLQIVNITCCNENPKPILKFANFLLRTALRLY